MAYITNSDVATFLNLDLTANGQAVVDAIIPGVEAEAERFCHRTWAPAGSIVETFDGGGNLFFPTTTPVATITSVVIDGITYDADLVYNYGSFLKLQDLSATGYRNVVITYTSGASVPADVKLALTRWTAELYLASSEGGKTVERSRIGEVEQWYAVQDGMPKYVEQVLSRYRLHPL